MMTGSDKPRQVHLLHADSLGGGPVVVAGQLRHFAKSWEVELWCGGDGVACETARNLGLTIQRFRLEGRLSALMQIPALVRELKRRPPDVLVLHGQWAGAVGAWAARLAGCDRVVYIAHCPAFYHSTSMLRAIRNYFAEKWPCQIARKVVALSEGNHYGYLYRGWVPEERLVLIHNGVEPDDIPGQEAIEKFRREKLVPNDGVHGVFVGRIDDQKRVDWLVRAWGAALSARGAGAPPWHLWIVGGGSGSGNREKEVTRLVGELGLGESVHFVGPSREANLWLGAADFVILSSLYEGHALVPLEAMSLSKPVVAFATDGVSDSVESEKTGLLAELGNVEDLGCQIARLANDGGLRDSMGAAGRRRLIDCFALERSLSRYGELYDEVAGIKSPS